jgi:hypothetical protein
MVVYRIEYREHGAAPFIWQYLSTSDYVCLDCAKAAQLRVDSLLITRILKITTEVVK